MESISYNPEDEFQNKGTKTGLTVLDFWKYAYSDLNSDPRDVIAEFLVSNALGIKESTNRQDWTPYDIDYKGVRIEIKCTGYFQTFREDGKTSDARRFSVRKAIDRKTKTYERHNDIYVFCLLNGKTRKQANPLVLENWDFYVIPTSIINAECADNRTISLSKVKKIAQRKLSYDELKDEIRIFSGLILMKNTLKELDKSQIEFICKECNIDEETLNAMNEEQIYDVVYETMCNIEIDEVCNNINEEDSERCEVASNIVTIMGNALAEGNGYFDKDEIKVLFIKEE